MKRMQNQAKSVSKRTWREKMTYMKKNWQLYLFFLMPGLLLTIIFKYLPMGGLLIAFEDYNVSERLGSIKRTSTPPKAEVCNAWFNPSVGRK